MPSPPESTLTMRKANKSFMLDCESCGRQHQMIWKPCPCCGGRGGWTPQPASEIVADNCAANYDCDGCLAYREHQH